MKITNLDEIERVPMRMEGAKDVVKQVPISQRDGAPNFVFRVFTIGPGGHTPYHEHPAEHVNYIIAGRGVVVSATGEEHPVAKPNCYGSDTHGSEVPPDERCRFNTSRRPQMQHARPDPQERARCTHMQDKPREVGNSADTWHELIPVEGEPCDARAAVPASMRPSMTRRG